MKHLQQSLAAKSRWKKAGKRGIKLHIEKMNLARIIKMARNKAILDKFFAKEKLSTGK